MPAHVELDISTLPLELNSNTSNPSISRNLRSFSAPNAFVKMSATCSSVFTYSRSISSNKTFSRMKC